MSTIANVNHVINYHPIVYPLDNKGERIKEGAVMIGKDLIRTMEQCLTFDHKKRITIPDLLEGPFLLKQGESCFFSLQCVSFG